MLQLINFKKNKRQLSIILPMLDSTKSPMLDVIGSSEDEENVQTKANNSNISEMVSALLIPANTHAKMKCVISKNVN